ncbi:MAG: hypothetical protein WA584_10055 [Pyrinomonadaceae bacterium]
MPIKANSKDFIEREFPELPNYKILTSRMYEKSEKPQNRDNWWFNFMHEALDDNEFIVFAGALDYRNKNFKVFKVPASYVKDNIGKLYMDKNGWIIIYLHIKDFVDVRKNSHLSFNQFSLN